MASGVPGRRSEPAAACAETLLHYETNAQTSWHGTRNHDVSQNLEAFLGALHGNAPFTLLDLGCGPGRDLKALADRGHRAVGLDGCAAFADHARAYSGCEVWQQEFLHLALPQAFFDGIFANASLFHVPRSEIRRVLGELRASLKAGGVLFSSNPRGNDEEGWNGGRFGVWWREDTWRALLGAAGFVEVITYYRPPGLPRAQQPWFAGVWRKTEG